MPRNEEFKNSALYHGTPHVFKPGDEILPAKKIGKKGSAESNLAYASKDFPVAKFMAWEQNNFNGSNFHPDAPEPPEHVYRVEPLDPSEKLGSHSSLMHVAQPDTETGYGKARDVTSRVGFRVLSKVQDPEKLNDMLRVKAGKTNKKFEDAGGEVRGGKVSYDKRYADYLAERTRKIDTREAQQKFLKNATKKSRKSRYGNTSRA